MLKKKEEQIIWNKEQKLTWNDFKGRPKNNSPAGALSFCGMRHYFSYKNGFIKINTETSFDCKKSWVNSEDKISSTLEHEQLHFNIAELYARKLRQELQTTKFKKMVKKHKTNLTLFISNILIS